MQNLPAVERAVAKFGRIDALVIDAIATNEPKALVDIGIGDYALVFDTGAQKDFDRALKSVPLQRAGRTREDIRRGGLPRRG